MNITNDVKEKATIENLMDSVVRFTKKIGSLEDKINEAKTNQKTMLTDITKLKKRLRLDPESIEANEKIEKELFGDNGGTKRGADITL